MKVRFILASGHWDKGDIVEVIKERAQYWIRRGLCEAVEEPEPPVAETATAEPDTEVAMAQPVKRKRGRPRKAKGRKAKGGGK